MQYFDTILQLVLGHEGGKVFDPRDPGGKTNRGITQKTYNAQRLEIMAIKGDNPYQIPEDKDVFDLTDEEIYFFYHYQFSRYFADQIQDPDTCYVFFDTLIISGPNRAIKILQHACNIDQDGMFGPNTKKMANSLNQRELRKKMLAYRMVFHAQSENSNIFGIGWKNRVDNITQQVEVGILNMEKNTIDNKKQQQQQQVQGQPKKR